MTAPAPFLDWLADRVGTRMWVVSPRLTDRLRAKDYELALSPARYNTLQAEHQKLLDRARAERIALRLFPDEDHDAYGWTNRIQDVADALAAEK